jgi:type I restriction-modification system DNA methylase subunit
LLDAVRALAFVERNRVLRAVNYRNLGSVELGSVYESLLELHPQINVPGRSFTLNIAAGNERKTTGSFYTPDSLVQCLLDSALEPVVADAIKGKTGVEAEKAILSLKVCDPAVGSGHFIIAAAHRSARHLVSVITSNAATSYRIKCRHLRS